MADRPTGDADAASPPAGRPAYYAARAGGWRDWWTLLHPPYTAWHLSYVVIGASLAPQVYLNRLLYAVAAFFLAVGVAAHALDELHGRPLRTGIPAAALAGVAAVSLAGAVALGVYGITQAGWILVPFMVAGPILVIAYNAELFNGILHNDLGFAAAWGAYPVAHRVRRPGWQPGPGRGRRRRGGPRAVGGAAPAEHPGSEHPAACDPDRRHDDPRGRDGGPARRGPAATPSGRGAARPVVRPHPARRRPGHRPVRMIRAGVLRVSGGFPRPLIPRQQSKVVFTGLTTRTRICCLAGIVGS